MKQFQFQVAGFVRWRCLGKAVIVVDTGAVLEVITLEMKRATLANRNGMMPA
jgi:hypothetical protein